MTHFVNIQSADPVVDYLVETLTATLRAGKRVLWLVPGGSSIKVAAAASKRLRHEPLENLIVTLTDERYGPVGHPDSNWRQLAEAGFDLPHATTVPVLKGLDMPSTVEEFAAVLKNHLGSADFTLGFFGIGADGHTAGILPNSPAVAAMGCAAGYNAGNFQRITMTAPAIHQLHEAVVYAVGEAKWPVIDDLAHHRDFVDQPAQALKSAGRLTVFNDHTGERA